MLDHLYARLGIRERQQARNAKIRLSVTALLAREKSRGLSVCAGIVLFIFLLHWFEEGFVASIQSWSTLLAFLFFVVVLLDNLLLYYRVANGFFGNTESEARELISYILRNSDRFRDGGDAHRIFEPAQTERQLFDEIYGSGQAGARI